MKNNLFKVVINIFFMVDIKDCKSLEERMFYLGSHCESLPLEPEPLNREYYNLGLETYFKTQEMRELKKIIDLNTALIKPQSKSNQICKETVDKTFTNIIGLYKTICENLSDESVPILAKSKVLEDIRFWVNMNYDLITKISIREFNQIYDSIMNQKSSNI